MARVRYETRCGGRLLKVIDQVEVPDFDGLPYLTAEWAADGAARYRAENDVPVVDGAFWWEADGQRVEPDVARAMLAEYGEQP
jgi:hypothetical protein